VRERLTEKRLRSMTRRLSTCLAALAVGALIAGCGGSSGSTTSSAKGATEKSGVAEAVKICQRLVVLGTPTLSTSNKVSLETMCNRAASSNLSEARKTVTEVCERVINSTPLTAASKETALAGCKSKVK
jgi:hypothetical protein